MFRRSPWLAATPDFTSSIAPSSASTAPGGAVSYTVSVSPVNGFTSDVSLALSGLPAGQASWTISPPVIAGGCGSAQLTVSTAASIGAGTYPLTITAASGATVHSEAAALVVTAPPDFTLSTTPASRNVVAGAGATYTVGVASLNRFAGNVSLTVAGLPTGTTAAFSPNPVGSPGSSTLTVKATSSARRGTYTLRITGTRGSLVHKATAALTVR